VTAFRLIAGLGNPGPRYAGTRHNAGFFVIDELARRHGLVPRFASQAEELRWGGVTLIKPTTFMNLSGRAVQGYLTRLGVRPEELLVIHDDLDLPLGRLRFKQGGGAGGQRGVADIIGRIGENFARLKVGISRPPEGWPTERWVLSRFRDDEAELLDRVIATAADAVEVALHGGLELAMNRFNALDLRQG
jgi:PTH1 family peptidyl-tRNA hydrolase